MRFLSTEGRNMQIFIVDWRCSMGTRAWRFSRFVSGTGSVWVSNVTDATRSCRLDTANRPDTNAEVERLIWKSQRVKVDGKLKISHALMHDVLQHRKVCPLDWYQNDKTQCLGDNTVDQKVVPSRNLGFNKAEKELHWICRDMLKSNEEFSALVVYCMLIKNNILLLFF